MEKVDFRKEFKELYSASSKDFSLVDVPPIYLSDPRKTEPPKLKTILRQPVKPLHG